MNELPYANKMVPSGKQLRVIKRFFFKKLGIAPNYNSVHELGALFQLLLYMYVNNLSAEEASSQLKIECNNELVASADTLLRRLKQADKKLVKKAFNSTVKKMLKGHSKQLSTIAIDYHDIPYYGNRNNPQVRGTRKQRGTNYCHKYATLEIVEGEYRLTLAVRKITEDNNEKAIVIKELMTIAKKHVVITNILLDREFYTVECIKTLKQSRIKYVIPVPRNKAIKKQIKEHSLKLPIVIPCKIGETETFNLCMIHGKPKNKNTPALVHCFATNIITKNAEEIAELYRKRWSIETGYKTKKQFRAKTTTQNNLVRMIYFYMECLLYNTWCNVKNITPTTIAAFKKTIEKLAAANFTTPASKET